MTAAQVRALERKLAERDAEIAGLRRMVLDVASTPAGLALLEAGTQTTANPDSHITITTSS